MTVPAEVTGGRGVVKEEVDMVTPRRGIKSRYRSGSNPADIDSTRTLPDSGNKQSKTHPRAGEPGRLALPPGREPDKSVTVLLADDHPVVREGLALLINRCPDMQV